MLFETALRRGHGILSLNVTPWRTRHGLPAVDLLTDNDRSAKLSPRLRGGLSGSAEHAYQRCSKAAR